MKHQLNETCRMQQLAGINLNEIKISNLAGINLESVKDFYKEHIDTGGEFPDEEDVTDEEYDRIMDDIPDFGGPDNLYDAGFEEYDLKVFLDRYKGMLSEVNIVLLWLYSFRDYLLYTYNHQNEIDMKSQIKLYKNYPESIINTLINLVKSDGKNT